MQDIRFRLILSFVFAVCLNFVISPSAPAADLPTPKWVWTDAESPRSREAFFRRTFDVTGEVTAAELTGVADFCRIDLYLNGERVGEIADFSPKFQIDVTDQIGSGRNVLAVGARSHAGPAAIALRLRLKFRDGSEQFYITDEDWRANSTASAEWNRSKPSAADWPKAVELGQLASEPWGDHADTLSINELDDYTQWKQALEQPEGTAPTNFFVLPGFKIDLVHSAQPDEGSWISLAFDSQGRVVIAREDSGLLRLSLNAENSKSVSVETINETLKECRGLLFAHDGLYANANNSKGLYRLRDTNGDDQFDEVKLLRETPGEKGHGRNDLAFGPDGAIYAIHGDSVETPEDIPSRLSPFRQNSHPGRRGFVMRSDPDGNHMEIVTSGLRNPYGIDFNVDGEMFTYDADAEYDMGAPWYRPTRVLHLLPGGDYGWRAVTRSWPPYDPDRADAAVPNFDVGKGSPTAVKFGTKSHFPPKYRRALFALDWSYGRILAVHMTPRGGSYAMRAETFLKGRPFNVTDLGFGPDGAMYVVTGGRKTQAGLYRVSYVGDLPAEPKPTIQQAARAKYSATARTTRHRLEEFQQRNDPAALDLAWDYLDSPDPALRYAARIAVEHQPLDQWRERAVEETRTQALLTALLALAQGCEADEFPRIINRLADVPIDKLPDGQHIIALRIFEIVLARDKNGSPEIKAAILAKLDPLYPATSTAINFQLCELLVSLQATDVIPRTLELLAGAATQEEQFQYIHVLRNVRKGWTPESQTRYFSWMAKMSRFVGGEGMPVFLSRIQADATSSLTEEELKRIEPLLARKAGFVEIPAAARNRTFVRKWTAADVEDLLKETNDRPDFERGRKLFVAAACSACHRLGGTGTVIGPDLTSVGRRFSRRDILQSILEPARVVAEQYRLDVIMTKAGKVISGTILPGNDYRSPELHILPDPLNPGEIVKIAKQNVEEHLKSESSLMPSGLLNTLTKQEILALLTYLETGGNPQHPRYRR